MNRRGLLIWQISAINKKLIYAQVEVSMVYTNPVNTDEEP